MTDKNQKELHIIKEIKSIETLTGPDEELKLLLSGGAFVTGALGLLTFCASYTQGNLATGAAVLTGITGISLILALSIYIKKKISCKLEINKLRERSGLTEEKQEQILEKLVNQGDKIGIELYNYFYGEEKRKKL